jgi:DNA invertase Pin-like site-specific DNA recombinase
MKGQRIGYVRVSTTDQNTDRQLEGIQLDRTFTDKASGKDTQRPALQEALAYVREGDVLVVHSLDRLARNLGDLREIVSTVTKRGVTIEFMKEHLTFTGEDSPMATLMLNLLGAVSEFERALIRERQREGIAVAKRKGVYKGRKPKLTSEQVVELHQRVQGGENKASIARAFGVSRETVYAYLNEAA